MILRPACMVHALLQMAVVDVENVFLTCFEGNSLKVDFGF